MLQDAIALAAKTNYNEALKIGEIGYVNNSFYTTYKDLAIVNDEVFLWRIELPEIPLGIGYNEGVSTLILKDSDSRQLTYPMVWLNENQRTFQRSMRPIPGKTLAYSEGKFIYIISIVILNYYTAQITMISGGDSTDLFSELNVPPDYFPVMMDYLVKQLMFARNVPVHATNDGSDVIRTT